MCPRRVRRFDGPIGACAIVPVSGTPSCPQPTASMSPQSLPQHGSTSVRIQTACRDIGGVPMSLILLPLIPILELYDDVRRAYEDK